jgi:hypothetical protein
MLRKFLIVLIATSVLFRLNAQTLSPQWVSTVTGTFPSDTYYNKDIQTDSFGNVYVLSFLGTASSLYFYDMILHKYDGSGNLLWRDTIPNATKDGRIAILPSGSVVVGFSGYFPPTSGTVDAVASFSQSGTIQWVHQFSSSPLLQSDIFASMVTDTTGSIYMASYFYSNVTGQQQGFIFKCDSTGNIIWSDSIAIANTSVIPHDIAVDHQGRIYAALELFNPSNNAFDGKLIKYYQNGQREYQIPFDSGFDDHFGFIRIFNDTAIYIGSSTGSYSDNFFSVIKYDSTGTLKFLSSFFPQPYFNWSGYDTTSEINTMEMNVSGDVFLGTSLFYPTNGWRAAVVQFHSSGAVGWVAVPYTLADASALSFDAVGNILVAGRCEDTTAATQAPLYLAKLDVNGSIMWKGKYGNVIFDKPGMSLDLNGNIFLSSVGSYSPDSLYVLKIGSTTGINEEYGQTTVVHIFPNPVSEVAIFDLSGIQDSGEILVFDNLGREVWRRKINGENQIEFSSENFSSGLYFYHLECKEGKTYSGKFIIQ